MATPALSETVTQGIRIGAAAFFLPQESRPEDHRFVFGYRIVIVNESAAPATLRTRHWIIIDGEGHVEEVRGEGVVGQQPRLLPGQGFKYASFCPLTTEWGTMEGWYQFESDSGESFDVKIGRFYLTRNRQE